MKHLRCLFILSLAFAVSMPLSLFAQKKRTSRANRDTLLVANSEGRGLLFEIKGVPGPGHNHPTFVVWIEKEDGTYIETLFATQYIGKGVFRYGKAEKGQWKPAAIQRRAALPYWGHKRGVVNEMGNYLPSASQPLPDAITGPTPRAAFTLLAKSTEPLNGKIRLCMEVNQTWDWNSHWNNSLYPNDPDYRSSAQPAVVYEALIDVGELPETPVKLNAIGRSHHSGATGELFTDLETITTALQIFNEITVRVKPQEGR